jgi:hypothetical protein
MSDTPLRLIAAERITERSITELCATVNKSMEYIDQHSNVTSDNVMSMQQVIALLSDVEYYALQAQLLLLTINKR